MNSIDILMRWLHLMGAIAAGGGSIFVLFALLPALRELPDDLRDRLHESVRRRFAMIIMAGITILLVSGLYNYLIVKRPLHAGQSLYHGLMGAKILLAMAVFFIASALVGRAKAFESLRRDRSKWLAINVATIAIIVAIGAVLARIPTSQ